MRERIAIATVLILVFSGVVIAQGWLTPTETHVGDGVLIEAVVLPDGSTMAIMRSTVGGQPHLLFVRQAQDSQVSGSIRLARPTEPESILVRVGEKELHVFVGWPDDTWGIAQVYRYSVALDGPSGSTGPPPPRKW